MEIEQLLNSHKNQDLEIVDTLHEWGAKEMDRRCDTRKRLG